MNTKKRILFKQKLVNTSFEAYQYGIGGVIWIKAKGTYPITRNELQRILDNYKEA